MYDEEGEKESTVRSVECDGSVVKMDGSCFVRVT